MTKTYNTDDFNLVWLADKGGASAPRLARELTGIGVGAYAAQLMAAKGDFYALRAEHLSAPAANILKQECLSKGAECAVNPQTILGGPEYAAAIMLATARQYRLIAAGLRRQQFGLPQLAEEIERALAGIANVSWQMPLPGGETLFLGVDTAIMGILNVTPDSFSDGGSYADTAQAISHAGQMLADGALIIDVGGESTRPGHQQISEDEEITRIIPVIGQLRAETDAIISVDTYKPRVARAALQAGAQILNDIWGLQYPGDPQHEMAQLAAEYNCPVIVMHNREMIADGERRLAAGDESCRSDILGDAAAFFRRSRAIAAAAGLPETQLIYDIGFGFGKTPEQNVELLAKLAGLSVLGQPLLSATSRKSTLGLLTGRDVNEREFATAATTAAAALSGAALVRVHDVAATRDVLAVCRALKQY